MKVGPGLSSSFTRCGFLEGHETKQSQRVRFSLCAFLRVAVPRHKFLFIDRLDRAGCLTTAKCVPAPAQPFLVAKTETPVSKKTESEAPINHCIGDIRLQVLIPKNRSSRYIFLLPILSILISTQFLPHRTTTLFTARCERLHSSHMPLPDGPPSLLFIDHSIRLLEASHFAANALCHPELNPQLSVWLSVPNRRRFYRHRKGE